MEKKCCSRCKRILPFGDFNKNVTKTDGHQSFCRTCSRRTSSELYQEEGSTVKKAILRQNARRRKDLATRIFDYLLEHPCVDCGEHNPVVLEFDHLSNKVSTLSDLVRRGCRWGIILSEIAKCEVRCSNCHTLKTAKQFRWLSYQLAAKHGFEMEPKLKN
jgi:hypothetical protein